MSDLNVIYKIAADISGLQSGVDRAAKATEKLGSTAERIGNLLTAKFAMEVGRAVLDMGKQVLDFASNLEDLSAKTGISTTGLQKFDLAFSQAGVTMDTVAAASVKLANNLVAGDKSTVGALQKLGLSVAELKRLAPEDQLLKVGDAIGQIANPTEKAYAAMQVFGKGGAELLRGLDGHLAETVEGFEALGLVVDEQTIKAIDDFGDSLGILGKQFIALAAEAIGPLLPMLGRMLQALVPVAKIIGETLTFAFKGFISVALLLGSSIERLIAEVLEAVRHIPILGRYLGIASDAAAALRADAQEADQVLDGLWKTTDQTGESAKKATPPIIGLGDGMKDAEERAKALKKALDEYAALLDDSLSTVANYERLVSQLGDALYEGIAYDHARGISVKSLATIYGVAESAVEEVIAVEKALADETEATTKAIEASLTAGAAAAAAVGQSLAGMPDVLRNLAQAGGTLRLDAKQSIGIATLIATGYAEAEQAITAAQTARLRSTLPLTAAMRELIDQMDQAGMTGEQMAQQLGMSMDELAARMRASGMRAVDIARTLGISIGEALGGGLKGSLANLLSGANLGNLIVQGLTGGGGFAGAMKGLASQIGGLFSQALGASIAKNMGGKLGGLLGGIIGPLGSLVGPLIGKIGGWFKNLFGGQEKEVDKMRRAFIGAQGGLEKLNELAVAAGASLTAMLDAKTPEAYKKAIDDLNAALEFQDSAMRTLDETVQKYGFTIEELGPAFGRQQLDKRAQELYQDFQVLAAAGVPVANIIGKMGKSLNEFVQSAIKSGIEVPASMKPILQAMIDHGELLDENGHAYESLEETGLSFSETMTQGFAKLIKTVDRLTEAIARGLGLALDRLPSEKNIDINVNTHHHSDEPGAPVPDDTAIPREETPEYAATGGLVTQSGIKPFRWPAAGTDIVPAMLSPGELVTPTGETSALLSRLDALAAIQTRGATTAGSGGGVHVGTVAVQMTVTENVDPHTLSDNFKEMLRTDASVYDAIAVVAQRKVAGAL